jgi:hypothetical protein
VIGADGAITELLTTDGKLAQGEVREILFRENGFTWLGHYGGGVSLLAQNGETRLLSLEQGLHKPFRPDSFRSFVREQLKDVLEPANLGSQ